MVSFLKFAEKNRGEVYFFFQNLHRKREKRERQTETGVVCASDHSAASMTCLRFVYSLWISCRLWHLFDHSRQERLVCSLPHGLSTSLDRRRCTARWNDHSSMDSLSLVALSQEPLLSRLNLDWCSLLVETFRILEENTNWNSKRKRFHQSG